MATPKIKVVKRRALPYGGARVEAVALFPVTLHGVLEAGRVYRGFARNPISDDGLWLSLHNRDITAGVLDVLGAYERGRSGEMSASLAIIMGMGGGS